MRCIDMPLRYHSRALIFVVIGLSRGVARVNAYTYGFPTTPSVP